MDTVLNMRGDMLPLIQRDFSGANTAAAACAEMQTFARRFRVETVRTRRVAL